MNARDGRAPEGALPELVSHGWSWAVDFTPMNAEVLSKANTDAGDVPGRLGRRRARKEPGRELWCAVSRQLIMEPKSRTQCHCISYRQGGESSERRVFGTWLK
jgi:hypothetical protein